MNNNLVLQKLSYKSTSFFVQRSIKAQLVHSWINVEAKKVVSTETKVTRQTLVDLQAKTLNLIVAFQSLNAQHARCSSWWSCLEVIIDGKSSCDNNNPLNGSWQVHNNCGIVGKLDNEEADYYCKKLSFKLEILELYDSTIAKNMLNHFSDYRFFSFKMNNHYKL